MASPDSFTESPAATCHRNEKLDEIERECGVL
jgi:hypothetical protein